MLASSKGRSGRPGALLASLVFLLAYGATLVGTGAASLWEVRHEGISIGEGSLAELVFLVGTGLIIIGAVTGVLAVAAFRGSSIARVVLTVVAVLATAWVALTVRAILTNGSGYGSLAATIPVQLLDLVGVGLLYRRSARQYLAGRVVTGRKG